MPASLGDWQIEPAANNRHCCALIVPDLEDYAAQLCARGISSEVAARIIHT